MFILHPQAEEIDLLRFGTLEVIPIFVNLVKLLKNIYKYGLSSLANSVNGYFLSF